MVAFRSTDTSGRTSGLLLRCVLYSLLALGLIISTSAYDHLGKIRRALSFVAYPVQLAVASPFEGWHWFRESVSTRDTLRADKARLEADLRVAEFRLQRYEALEAESQRLRALRENTAGVADRFIIGDIMDVDLDAFRERVLVDKGASEGVFVGQAVLDRAASSARWPASSSYTSEVILVSDPAHAIPVQINRNGFAHRGGRHGRHLAAEAPLSTHQRRRAWSATCWSPRASAAGSPSAIRWEPSTG